MHEFFKTFVRQTGLRTGASLCYPPCCLGLELILARSPLMGSCLCLLSEVSHDHAILTTSTLTEEKKNDLDFEQSLLSDEVRCANQKKKIAQIKIDVSKPLGKVTLEKYFSCPSLLEFRTVCFHQFVFPLVFFF